MSKRHLATGQGTISIEIWKVALRRHWALLLVVLVGTMLGAYVTVQ